MSSFLKYITLLMVCSVFSVDSYASCNVFRVKALSKQDIDLSSEISLCEPIANVPAQPTEPDVDPEASQSAWVDFMNTSCGRSFTDFNQIGETNLLYKCNTSTYTVLPPPAPTLFIQGLDFKNTSLSSLSGLDLVTKLPLLDISYSSVNNLIGLENVTTMGTLKASRSLLNTTEGLSKLESATFFDLAYAQLQSLNGLTALKSISTLNANNNAISDLSGLSSLETVNTLELSYNNLTSLSGLSGLRTVGTLNVNKNNLSSLDGLQGLTTATQIDARFNTNLTSLNGLENFTSIGRLLFQDSSNLNDVRGLRNISSASAMYFYSVFNDNNVTPTYRMEGDSVFCTNYRRGNINVIFNTYGSYEKLCHDNDKNITSPWVTFLNEDCHSRSPIETIDEIYSKTVTCNRFNISALPSQPEPTMFTNLYLDNNDLTNVDGLGNVTSVNILNLHFNKLTNIKGLKSLKSANTLSLQTNKLTTLNGLESLVTVGVLDLIYNDIYSLVGLSSLTSAGTLYLSNNKITALYGLESLTSVGTLYLSGNNIYTLEGLENLTSATSLSMMNSGTLARRLPYTTNFCQALAAGNLGTVNVNIPNINSPTDQDKYEYMCDDSVDVGSQGSRTIGTWVMGNMLWVSSTQGAKSSPPSGVCQVGEKYYSVPSNATHMGGDISSGCPNGQPWDVDYGQNYGGTNYVNSTGGSGSGTEGTLLCYNVIEFECKDETGVSGE